MIGWIVAIAIYLWSARVFYIMEREVSCFPPRWYECLLWPLIPIMFWLDTL